MAQKDRVLALLQSGEYISGETMSEMLGVSRNAVWKAVGALRDEGYDINAVQNRGYRLCGGDILSAPLIEKYADFEADIRYFPCVDSTNSLAKELAAGGVPEWTTIIASEQTAGRGRRGRSFFSPFGSGVYMSIILRPRISAEKSLLITTAAATAVCDAAKTVFGTDTGIKWVNDIYKNGLKVCGILTEAEIDLESKGLKYAVLGIGTNLFGNAFPDELCNIAGYLCDAPCTAQQKARFTAEILNCFKRKYERLEQKEYLEEYRSRLILNGRKITVLSGGNAISATAIGIDDDFRLLVRYDDGHEELLSSGEVSIKL